MKNPLNWLTVFFMLLLVAIAGHLFLSLLGIQPSTKDSQLSETSESPAVQNVVAIASESAQADIFFSHELGGNTVGAQTQRVDPRVLNMQQRALVLNQAVEMTQQIYSTNLSTPSNAPVVNVVPRNVGLIKKFIVVVTGTVGNTSATNTLSITDFG